MLPHGWRQQKVQRLQAPCFDCRKVTFDQWSCSCESPEELAVTEEPQPIQLQDSRVHAEVRPVMAMRRSISCRAPEQSPDVSVEWVPFFPTLNTRLVTC